MTTNIDRAADIINSFCCGYCEHFGQEQSRALADAGLLAPDALPPRDLYDDWGVWPINEHPSHYVEMRITGTGRRLIDMYAPPQMGPATARRLAAALLAAANHAEGVGRADA